MDVNGDQFDQDLQLEIVLKDEFVTGMILTLRIFFNRKRFPSRSTLRMRT